MAASSRNPKRSVVGVGLNHFENTYLDEVGSLLEKMGCSRRERCRSVLIRRHVHNAATFFDLPPLYLELLLADMSHRGIEDRSTYIKQILSDRAQFLAARNAPADPASRP